jgi:hypothetical protein
MMKTSIKVWSLIAVTAFCILPGGTVSAQQSQIGGDTGNMPPAPTISAEPTKDIKPPDISGKWIEESGGDGQELTIRETTKGPAGFTHELAQDTSNTIFLRWDPAAERFCGENSLPDRITVRIQRNGSILRITSAPQNSDGSVLVGTKVIFTNWVRPPTASQIQIIHLQHADSRIVKETLETLLSRESPSLHATAVSSNNSLILSGSEDLLMKAIEIIKGIDVAEVKNTTSSERISVHPRAHSASNEFSEQLRSLEHAVLEEAERLRRLEAKTDEKQDQQKLKTLLSQALDLKLQAEETQVLELRAKLERLQTQIATRKERREKIVARRVNELLGADATNWTPENVRKKVGETAAKKSVKEGQLSDPDRSIVKGPENPNAKASSPMGATQNSPGFEDIVRIQAELDEVPSATLMHERRDRILELRKLVGELEVRYYKDRTKSAELRSAINELMNARSEYKRQWKQIESMQMLLLNYGLRQRLTTLEKSALEKLSASEKGVLAKNSAREMEQLRQVVNGVEAFGAAGSESDPWGLEDNTPFADAVPAAAHAIALHPDAALALLERTTELRLELVRFDDLKLPFKAALRVREAYQEFKTGDLIVVLNGQLFQSWNQAVEALRSRALPGSNGNQETVVLGEGLLGGIKRINFAARWDQDYTKPGSPSEAHANFEVRVREAGKEVETHYVSGVMLSLDGLAVIPTSSKWLVPGEEIVMYGHFTGTARVVGSDDEHNLSLVKVESRDKRFFTWLKCRIGLPAKGQSLSTAHPTSNSNRATILITGQPYPNPFSGTDAFVVERSEDDETAPGSMYVAKDGCLQGIKAIWEYQLPSDQKSGTESDARVASHRDWAIPAVHIENLLNKYRPPQAK